MKELMFNIHDLVLALFAGECFLIALILMWGLAHKHLRQRLLMVLALLNGMIAAMFILTPQAFDTPIRTRGVGLVLATAWALVPLGLLVASQLGSEFLPELNEGTIWVNVRLPASISNDEAAKTLHNVRKALMTIEPKDTPTK